MGRKEEILAFMRQKGPVIPVDIAKLLSTDIILASAHLSELSSKGMVKVSKVKVGGTPLYYLSGQEAKLQNYADRLHEKERRAYELLKQKRVLKDSEQTPVVRFALRQIRDFAKPLEVKVGEEKQLFWRWYLTPTSEIEGQIRGSMGQPTQRKSEPKLEQRPKLTPKVEPRLALREESKPEPKMGSQPEPRSHTSQIVSGPFLNKVMNFFEQNRIIVMQEEIVKKSKHAWFIAKVPSAIGSLSYYVEAKSKKRIAEGDLSEALIRGNHKKLPVLFITDGKLTKKTDELLATELKGITIKSI